ncbi:MAG TPA: hypothetical protein VKI18_06570 [Albitalea sp.]|nr:hypothetical protein [Albitalea sp.]
MRTQPGVQGVVDVEAAHQRIGERHRGAVRVGPQRRVRQLAARVGDLRIVESHAGRDRVDMQVPLVVVVRCHAGAQDQQLAQALGQHAAVQQAARAEQAAVDHLHEQAFVAGHRAEDGGRRHTLGHEAREARLQGVGVGRGDGGDAGHGISFVSLPKQ